MEVMKIVSAGLLALLLLGLCCTLFMGCGPAPPCETSLVTLDETRLDAETYGRKRPRRGKRLPIWNRNLLKKIKISKR
jgi:hypothetical protein